MVSSSLVEACTTVVFLWVKRGRSTPYFLEYSVFRCLFATHVNGVLQQGSQQG